MLVSNCSLRSFRQPALQGRRTVSTGPRLNVTTVDPGTYRPGSYGYDGVEVVAIGGSSGGTEGGDSYWNGFFMWGRNTAYVYPGDLRNDPRLIADAVSHEAGHAFGLDHQSLWDNNLLVNEYNPGNADGG